MKPDNMKVGTWYKSGNIMMYPYKRNEDVFIQGRNTDAFSMLTFQVIIHWGPTRWEFEDSDEWQIRVDEEWKKRNKSNVDTTTYLRNYLYLDPKEHVIEDDDIESPNADDFRTLVHAIFAYQEGWS